MSDKDPKQVEADPSSSRSPSSSEPLPLQGSLARLLGEVAKGLRGSSAATLKLHERQLAIETLLESNSLTLEELQKRVGELRFEGVSLTESHRVQTEAVKQLITVVIDSRQSVDASRQQVDATVVKLEKFAKDITTGQHKLLNPEDEDGEAPHILRVIVVKLTNFSWKNKAKVVGWISLAAVSVKHAWDMITPYIGGLHR